jgi:hypothetical protein
MKHVSLFALVLGMGILSACQSPSGRGCCPSISANCCGWDFYKKCDLIEGRVGPECGYVDVAPGIGYSHARGMAIESPSAPPPPPPPAEEIEEEFEDFDEPTPPPGS